MIHRTQRDVEMALPRSRRIYKRAAWRFAWVGRRPNCSRGGFSGVARPLRCGGLLEAANRWRGGLQTCIAAAEGARCGGFWGGDPSRMGAAVCGIVIFFSQRKRLMMKLRTGLATAAIVLCPGVMFAEVADS